MIITVSGRPGCGKSTVAKLLAKELNLEHKSSGDFMRALVKERNTTLIELSKEADTDGGIVDKEIDDRTRKFGQEHDNFVMDSRLAWYFIPHSIKVYLEVDEQIGVKRIYMAKRDDEDNIDLEKAKKDTLWRSECERRRFKEYYDVDFLDTSNYDLVVDTNSIQADEVTNKIIEWLKSTGKI